MKKQMVWLLSAAMIGMAMMSCTPSEPDLKKTDYLKLVHSTVNTPISKADKTLKKKGFTEVDKSEVGVNERLDGKAYEFKSKDEKTVLQVFLVQESDTVKQYMIGAELSGSEHLGDVQKLHADWTNYAYNTIFSEITIWNASYGSLLGDEEGTIYIDGSLAKTLKTMVQAYYLTGQMDEDMYNAIMTAFEHTRDLFEADMQAASFLKNSSLMESYAHATSTLDLSNLKNLKGTVGLLNVDSDGDEWAVMFYYMNEQSLGDILDIIPEF
jgi:hypothetical protein